MQASSKPSLGLLLALALAAEDQEKADEIVKKYLKREISLEEAIERLRLLPTRANII